MRATTHERVRVGIGVLLQATLFLSYCIVGICLLCRVPKPATINGLLLQIYIYSIISILSALRTVVLLLKSYVLFILHKPTQPTRREILLRIGLTIYVFLHGIIIWGVSTKASKHWVSEHYHGLWIFYNVTVWTNTISVCFLPFALKSSLAVLNRRNESDDERLRHHATISSYVHRSMTTFLRKEESSVSGNEEDSQRHYSDSSLEGGDIRLNQVNFSV